MAEPAWNKAGAGSHRITLGRVRGRSSVAAELALLAELHAKGALSDEEFSAAKLRTLGD
ncbi:SHOCT domain-containing protein [Arthrobacter sp. ISL-69]|uniref:SHOCT domain-containing protein n=1 Tax=Arthrobacter sp. ISL-69 TaxID=2819113 RepID=UPI001BECF0EF|nr:SHOCT domain-containing protein [Arthrobacter sp. ISL-69]MBT2537357.1 SHOCT domain-containing protein [Arthrobacter sp. ISL-69]